MRGLSYRLNAIALVLSLNAPAAFGAEPSGLQVSPPSQPTAEYALEWRRVRNLMRACGAGEDALKPLLFGEGLLRFLKSQDAKAHGQSTLQDPEFALRHQDDVEANAANCAKVSREIDPLLKAINAYVECNGKRKASAQLGECPIAIYRAPQFP